jgi:hypothetical protein
MNPELNHMLAQHRGAELQRAGEQAPRASELPRARSRAARLPQTTERTNATAFTLRGHHIAKLDRFLGQAQRAALRAEREFEGVSIEIDAHGVVSVHAIGMTSVVL